MLKVYLAFDNGFKWNQGSNVQVKGFGFINRNLIKDDEFARTVKKESNIENLLYNINGPYSFIREDRDIVYAAVDRIRSFPLFYAEYDENLFVSDSPRWIRDQIDVTYNNSGENEFLLAGFVSGRNTLIAPIKQLQAGEYLTYDKNKKVLNIINYYSFKHNLSEDFSPTIEGLDKIHNKVFQRLIDSLQGRPAVVPLSGGYDSRLIVMKLKELGYENVICFTYGRRDEWEVNISKQVADTIGYKWVFIPYDRKSMYQMYNSEDRKQYYNYSGRFVSSPHIQDWFAVKTLKEKSIIPNESVIIPGHTGDFISGEHIPSYYAEHDSLKKEDLLQDILKYHYKLWDKSRISNNEFKSIKDKIDKQLKTQKNILSNKVIADLYENWVWQERQAKFICNSLRVYEFFGYEWRLPLWDHDLMEYWSEVPFRLRINRNFYIKYANEMQQLPIDTPNPKRNRLKQIYDRITDVKFARQTGDKNIISAMFVKNKDIIEEFEHSLVDKERLLYRTNINAINAALYLEENILQKEGE